MVSIKGDIPEATENLKGLMSADDKIKLNALKDVEIVNNKNEIIDDGIYIIDLPVFMKGKVNFINNSNQAVFNPPNDENVDIQINWGDGTIDKGTQKTYAHTYADNTKTYNVTIKGDVNTIRAGLFPLGFEEIELRKPVNLVSATFAQNSGTELLKKLILPYGINQLPTEICNHLSTLIYVNIPDSVTTLDIACFYGCTGLTSITIPDSVTSIGNYCFQGCTSLTSIDIPDSITSIGESCFQGCTNLTSINIPNSVTSIGNYCFQGCTSLTSIDIPDSITSIGESCFYNCNNLIDYQLYWEGNNIIAYADYIFRNISANTTFTIPNGETDNYITKYYPSDKLIERNE